MASTVILITGANSGVGFATAKILVSSSETYHVVMAGRSEERLQAAKADLEAQQIKGSLSTMQLDVTDESSVQAAAASIGERFGRLDVLINNAGVGSGALDGLPSASEAAAVKRRFHHCLDTNVIGPAMIAAAFRPLLLKSQNAYSIYVGSGERTLVRNAHQKFPNAPPGSTDAYQVSKAALNMLAVIEQRDYGERGLKVFVISPGFVISNLRGTSDEQRTGWGKAGDPEVSGHIFLEVIQGKRDDQVGHLLHKDGFHEW